MGERSNDTLHRRQLLKAAAGAGAFGLGAGLAARSGLAVAQGAYPNKPIRIVVGFAAGGPSDLISRIVGAKMAEIMGAQFVDREQDRRRRFDRDAGGRALRARRLHAAQHAARPPWSTSSCRRRSSTNTARTSSRCARRPRPPTSWWSHPSLGVKTVADLVKLAKEKPGELQYATAGRGSATHLNSELFNMVAGIKTVPVHYRGGGDTVKDLLSGEVKMMFSSIAPVQEFVRDGRLVGLATTGPEARSGVPGSADHRRVRLSGLRRAAVDRHDGAGRHAEGHHPQARGCQQEGAGIARRSRRRWRPRALRR